MRECTSGIIIPEGEPLYIHIHIPVWIQTIFHETSCTTASIPQMEFAAHGGEQLWLSVWNGVQFSSALFFAAEASPAAVVYFCACAPSWSWGCNLLLLLHADMLTLFLAEICRWLLHLRSPDWSKSTGQSWIWSICDSICGGECDSGCHPQQQGAAFRFHSLVDPAKPFSQWQSDAIERRVRMLNLPGTPHFVHHRLSCCLRSSFLVHLCRGAKVDVYKLFVACNCLAMT